MPLYEYQCKHCQESFEKIVRFAEATLLPPCPTCGSTDTRKKISAAASLGNSTGGSTGGSCGSGGGFT